MTLANASTLPEGYADLLTLLKGVIAQARQRAALAINAELGQPNRAFGVLKGKLVRVGGKSAGWWAEGFSELKKQKPPTYRRRPLSTENPQSLKATLSRRSVSWQRKNA